MRFRRTITTPCLLCFIGTTTANASPPPPRRSLFVGDGSYCNVDGTTSVGAVGDFRFNSIVFAPKYQPTCERTRMGNGGDQLLHCINACETCYDDICGILETTEHYAGAAADGRAGAEAHHYSLCMTYTAGEATGKTCFEYQLEDPALLAGEDDSIDCQLKHNDEPCTWCKLFSNGCIQSNCTNFLPDARVNTCRDFNQGLEQQFRMASLINSLPKTREVAQGKCDVTLAPTPSPTTAANNGKGSQDDLELGPPPSSSSSNSSTSGGPLPMRSALWVIMPILASLFFWMAENS